MESKELNWRVNKNERALIDKIADRFIEMINASYKNFDIDKDSVQMDVIATHNHNYKLDLEKLLNFDDFNFWHDMSGIYNCMDRSTGILQNNFIPRCSK